jgi:hypothetical protein
MVAGGATIAGAALDSPAVGDGDGWSLTVAGWVVGRGSAPVEIHVLHDGGVVGRTPVDIERADVAAAVPTHERSGRSGFRLHIGILGLPTRAPLEVVAVNPDGSPAHLGTIHLEHRGLVTSYEPRLSPISVTSLGRMGTTWLMRLLGSHPEIAVHSQYPYELGVAKYWAHLLLVATGPADHARSAHPETLTADASRVGHNPYFGDFLAGSPELNEWLGVRQPAVIGSCAQQSLDEFYGRVDGGAGAGFFAEKCLPDHVPDVLGDLYAGWQEVILVRDIRDVICSAIAFDAKRKRQSFGRELFSDDLDFVTQLRMDLARLYRSWERRRPASLLVHYEDLVAAPAETVRGILSHLGLAHTPAVVARVFETASASTPELDGHRTTADPAASIGRWRSDLAAIHPQLPGRCEDLFGPLLTDFGYSVRPIRSRHMADRLTAVLDKLEDRGPELAVVDHARDAEAS